MTINAEPPQHSVDDLHSLFKADFEAGKLFWKPRPRSRFATDRTWRAWNIRFSGQEAFSSIDAEGYKRGKCGGAKYLAHRVLWALKYGAWPDAQIDHQNHDRTDNRIENLRCVTHRENCLNKSRDRRNTSGATGVFATRWGQYEYWRAAISLASGHRKRKCFPFTDEGKEAAINWRKEKMEQHGYHKNHGLDQ